MRLSITKKSPIAIVTTVSIHPKRCLLFVGKPDRGPELRQCRVVRTQSSHEPRTQGLRRESFRILTLLGGQGERIELQRQNARRLARGLFIRSGVHLAAPA